MKFLWSEKNEKEIESSSIDPNSDLERRFASLIDEDIDIAMTAKTIDQDETGLTVEETWDDEYRLYKGGGLQWSTNMAYRSKKKRRIRPNSEDNFIFNMVQIQVSNITANMPEISVQGVKAKHREHAKKVQHLCNFIDHRNKLQQRWDEWVTEYIAYGPIIVETCWDPEWIGGAGPDRWIGDIKLTQVDKKDFFPDPAILDLTERMNDCAYIAYRSRVKSDYVRQRWEEFKKVIIDETNDDDIQDEGSDPEMVYLWKYYHRSFPEFMPPERKKELRERADKQASEGDYYKSEDLYDMANGDVEGIHLAYFCNGMLLEYIPYVYDHGEYPFSFETRYKDSQAQWGWGEIRNTKIPQINHNKADEVELEAMMKQGLGGGMYEKGAISDRQMNSIIENSGKGGMYHEVTSLARIKENTGVTVPQSLVNYKEHKQRMIENISSVTPIQQGMAPSGNLPFKAIAELGARTDVRMKKAAKKLSNLLISINKQKIKLIAQFYTEERYYRYEDANGEIQEGTFRNDELFDVWDREMVEVPQYDAQGNEFMAQVPRKEIFVPEFDIKVSVLSSKPDDRNYYTQLAFDLYNLGWLVGEDLLFTLDEGKLPPNDEILKKVYAKDMIKQMSNDLAQFPPEMQQGIMQIQAESLRAMAANMEAKMQSGMDAVSQGVGQMQDEAKAQQKMNMMGQSQPGPGGMY